MRLTRGNKLTRNTEEQDIGYFSCEHGGRRHKQLSTEIKPNTALTKAAKTTLTDPSSPVSATKA